MLPVFVQFWHEIYSVALFVDYYVNLIFIVKEDLVNADVRILLHQLRF